MKLARNEVEIRQHIAEANAEQIAKEAWKAGEIWMSHIFISVNLDEKFTGKRDSLLTSHHHSKLKLPVIEVETFFSRKE